MYHRIPTPELYSGLTGSEKRFSLPADKFREQMEFLSKSGYRFVNTAQLVDYASGEIDLDIKTVLITFDDGCLSIYKNALPILKEYNIPAIVFITTDSKSHIFNFDKINERQINSDEIKELLNNNVSIGSHCVTHRPLTGLKDFEIKEELKDSKAILESQTDKSVDYLAVPGNWINKKVIIIAKECGYKAVFTSFPDRIKKNVNVYKIPRINVEGTLSLDEFKFRICKNGILVKKYKSKLKRLPSVILGPDIWIPLRKKIYSNKNV